MTWARSAFRWLMIAAAVFALLYAIAYLRLRRRDFEALANQHVTREKHLIVEAIRADRRASKDESIEDARSWTARARTFRARADEEARLQEKYRAAARSPWLPVAPDPPEPK